MLGVEGQVRLLAVFCNRSDGNSVGSFAQLENRNFLSAVSPAVIYGTTIWARQLQFMPPCDLPLPWTL
jgi:hypothetical protein